MADLYAIVGDMTRARFMLKAKVPWLQLRFKNAPLHAHIEELKAWFSEFPGTKVIINDDLDFAVACGAWGVHLGQEDLLRHARDDITKAPLKVGISTHTDAEIQHALDFNPDMLGFGPIFSTDTKNVGHPAQGAARLRQVVNQLPVPIVAIGGINHENLDAVVQTGVPMVAMIAYLDNFTEPRQLSALMKKLKSPGEQG